MRVLDLIAALDPRPSRVVDATPGAIAVEPLVGGIPCVAAGEATIGPGDLIVVAAGGDPPAYADLADEVRARSHLPEGTAVLVLSGQDLIHLSVPLVLAWAQQLGAEIVAGEQLPYRWFSSGLVLSVRGRGDDTQRIRNELVLRGALQRDLSEQVRRARSERDDAVWKHSNLRQRHDQAHAETQRLRRSVESLERQVVELEHSVSAADDAETRARREAARIEASTAYQFGRTLLRALKPSRRTLLLPRDLWRLFRRRGAWREHPAGDARTTSPATTAEQSRGQRLFAAFRSLPTPAEPPLIAGVFSRSTAAHMSDDLPTLAMWPNDIELMFERAEPTVLVVESAAAGPGEPWGGLGSPTGVPASIVVGAVVAEAARRGVPTVFWWTSPSHMSPGLRRLADRCDLVASDPTVPGTDPGTPVGPGVALGRFNPPPPAERAGRPLIHLGSYDPDPRNDSADPILRAAVELGAEVRFDVSGFRPLTEALGVEAAAAAYRSAAWAVANPTGALTVGACSSRTAALVACGTPVVARTGSVDEELSDVVTEVRGADDIAEAVAHATSRALTAAQAAATLRLLWRTSTPIAQMRRLLTAVDAEVGGLDVAHRIGIRCVRRDITGLVDAVLSQSHLPVEVLIDDPVDQEVARWAPELQAAGIEVRPVAEATTSAWAIWSGSNGWNEEHLANLLVARTTTGHDRLESDSGPLLESPNPAASSAAAPWWLVGSP